MGESCQAAPHPPAVSFRDPAGSVVVLNGRILRVVGGAGMADLRAFLQSNAGRRCLEAERVVRTDVLEGPELAEIVEKPWIKDVVSAHAGATIVEHECIRFPSYPYEWAPEMLHAAAALTLDLSRELLADGFGLKDGTPYNVLFRGPEPVFIDVLSFERRDPDDPTWLPYAQFVRTFLLPLLAHRYFGLGLDALLTTRRDGLEPEEVYAWATPFQRIRPPFLSLVSIPTWLAARHCEADTSIYRKRPSGNPEKARFILESLFRRLSRTLTRLEPASGRHSSWSEYAASNSYLPQEAAAKDDFVSQAMGEFSPKAVLDVGCNTGRFSTIAARSGASVVAVDYDPVVAGKLWRQARSERLDILPLVVNLTRPSPGIGWRNRECRSFLDRARGAFDAVLMLAVIHHMLVTERIPLPEVLDLAAELSADLALIEFIGPEDPMFRRIAHGRDDLHRNLSPAAFEAAAARHFRIVRRRQLGGGNRCLYLLQKVNSR
jgi:SAM-dependent methyltransferase